MGLEAVELLFRLEVEFGVEIPDMEAEKVYSVDDTVEFGDLPLVKSYWNSEMSIDEPDVKGMILSMYAAYLWTY